MDAGLYIIGMIAAGLLIGWPIIALLRRHRYTWQWEGKAMRTIWDDGAGVIVRSRSCKTCHLHHDDVYFMRFQSSGFQPGTVELG